MKETSYKVYVSPEPGSRSIALSTHIYDSKFSVEKTPVVPTRTTNFAIESRPVEGDPDKHRVTTTRFASEVQVYPTVDTAISRKRLALTAKRITSYYSLPVTVTAIGASLAEVIPSLSEKQFAWEWAAVGAASLSIIFADRFLPDTEKTAAQLQKLKSYKRRGGKKKVSTVPAQRRPLHDMLPGRVTPAHS